MNYICFMFQTAIVSAGLFSAENSYIHFITQRPLPFLLLSPPHTGHKTGFPLPKK